MSRRVLIFFPQNPLPPRSGAHARFLEVVGGLRAFGCRLFLVSSRLTTETPWTAESERELANLGFEAVRVHRPGVRDYAVAGAIMLPHRLRGTAPHFDSRAYAPPGLVRTFRDAVTEFDPDVLFVNYAYWDRLIDHHADRDRLRVIDTLDLLTLQASMRVAVGRHLKRTGRVNPSDVAQEVLREDFYEGLGLTVGTDELAVYDRYSVTVAISEGETELIRQRAPHTRVVHLPVTHPSASVANEYAGPPVFVAGNNPYNVQGYCYLARRVLPDVRKSRPDLVVRVAGPICDRVTPAEGVELVGYVPDVATEYARARFAVCPVFGGTGQQIKIVEAMAHGLPVVALKAAADRSPLRHGETGLVASDAAEFVRHVRDLWDDPDRCRKLGEAARAVVAETLSRDRLLCGLREILGFPT